MLPEAFIKTPVLSSERAGVLFFIPQRYERFRNMESMLSSLPSN